MYEEYEEIFSKEHDMSFDYVSDYFKAHEHEAKHHHFIHHDHSMIDKEHHTFDAEDYVTYFNLFKEEKKNIPQANLNKMMKQKEYDCFDHHDDNDMYHKICDYSDETCMNYFARMDDQ